MFSTAKIHFLAMSGSSHEPATARRRARRQPENGRVVGHCPSFMSVGFARTTRRTAEDLDGLFSFLILDFFFFLTRSKEDDEVDDEEEEGSP